jgi:hypothetical protein
MKIFNLDCHISVIADLKKIFEELGHEVTSWSVSGHNWVFNRQPAKVEIVNADSWRALDDKMIEEFYEHYKDELSIYDAFICTYPLTFSLLYEKFNKPIILHIPIRYEVPFQSKPEMWNNFNIYLQNGIDNGKIIPVANSLYDKKYFEFFVNRECILIQNLCEYTNTIWSPKYNAFLYSSRLNVNFNTPQIIEKYKLGRYEWSDISNFLGIIIIPYTSSLMSIFEHYMACIPLFFPSKNFIMELYKNYGDVVLSEITWNRVYGLKSGSIIDCDRNNDPNDFENLDIMSNWIDYSDFYNLENMPYITYFDSFEDLFVKLSTTNLNEIHIKMKEKNIERKKLVYSSWKNILDKL